MYRATKIAYIYTHKGTYISIYIYVYTYIFKYNNIVIILDFKLVLDEQKLIFWAEKLEVDCSVVTVRAKQPLLVRPGR